MLTAVVPLGTESVTQRYWPGPNPADTLSSRKWHAETGNSQADTQKPFAVIDLNFCPYITNPTFSLSLGNPICVYTHTHTHTF